MHSASALAVPQPDIQQAPACPDAPLHQEDQPAPRARCRHWSNLLPARLHRQLGYGQGFEGCGDMRGDRHLRAVVLSTIRYLLGARYGVAGEQLRPLPVRALRIRPHFPEVWNQPVRVLAQQCWSSSPCALLPPVGDLGLPVLQAQDTPARYGQGKSGSQPQQVLAPRDQLGVHALAEAPEETG